MTEQEIQYRDHILFEFNNITQQIIVIEVELDTLEKEYSEHMRNRIPYDTTTFDNQINKYNELCERLKNIREEIIKMAETI